MGSKQGSQDSWPFVRDDAIDGDNVTLDTLQTALETGLGTA